jgi:hypothetical protein
VVFHREKPMRHADEYSLRDSGEFTNEEHLVFEASDVLQNRSQPLLIPASLISLSFSAAGKS